MFRAVSASFRADVRALRPVACRSFFATVCALAMTAAFAAPTASASPASSSKQIVFVRVQEDLTRPELVARVKNEWLPQLRSQHPDVDRCYLNTLLYISKPAPDDSIPADVVLELWSHEALGPTLTRLAGSSATVATYDVETLVEKDEVKRPVGITHGFKWVAPLREKPGMARSDVRRRWDSHVAVALKAHPVQTYIRHSVDRRSSGAADYFGIATLTFADEATMLNPYFDDHSRQLVEQDISGFVGWYSPMVMSEEVMW